MRGLLADRTYRHLYGAQVIALVGTGLATVALGLLAYDLAGAEAGAVLGTALAIKMIAYVTVAPVAGAFAEILPRRTVLVTLDLVRASVAVFLPFVTEVWQIYALIFLLQSASAAFTPTFQATIPDVLPKERDYTRALSLSRLAYDLENLVSPTLAALLLTIASFHSLFVGTVLGFLASAALVVSVHLPLHPDHERRSICNRTTKGLRIYLKTPRLRGLLAICLSVSAAGAMVIVNTVVLVQSNLGLLQRDTAFALAAFGGGSMIAALALPRLLEAAGDRPVMLSATVVLFLGLIAAAFARNFGLVLLLWLVLGLAYSAAQIPSGRLLRRSSHPGERPALFAAHFALSHAAWLICYPLAGWLGAEAGLSIAALALASLAAAGFVLALILWPARYEQEIQHRHDNLPVDDPHMAEGKHRQGHQHTHAVILDHLHPEWPREH